MLANYLIGLREGLEASLVVGILVAYLVRTGNRHRLGAIWAGVAIAVGLSLGFGALLSYTSAQLSDEAQEAFAGILSVVAVGFVTWMVFWMKRASRNLRGELHDRLETALAVGAAALATTAFLAVAREGLETALFLWTAVKSTDQTGAPLVGAGLGLATAVVLGYLLYRGALRLNLATFFRWTGVALIVVAAGVLAYGVHDLQEAGLLPGEDLLAFDVTGVIAPDTLLASLVKGIFNISPAMTVLEVVAWLAYLVPTLWLYLRPARTATATPATSAPSAVTPAATTPATEAERATRG